MHAQFTHALWSSGGFTAARKDYLEPIRRSVTATTELPAMPTICVFLLLLVVPLVPVPCNLAHAAEYEENKINDLLVHASEWQVRDFLADRGSGNKTGESGDSPQAKPLRFAEVLRELSDEWVQADIDKCLRPVEKAAEAGDVQAMNMLAVLYLRGLFVPEDVQASVGWLELSTSTGDALAKALLAECYLKGVGVGGDAVRAKAMLMESFRSGCPHAAYVLAVGCETASFNVTDADLAAIDNEIKRLRRLDPRNKSVFRGRSTSYMIREYLWTPRQVGIGNYYAIAACDGHTDACYDFGFFLYRGDLAREYAHSEWGKMWVWWKVGHTLGHAGCSHKYAECLLTGATPEHGPRSEVLETLEVAAARGYGESTDLIRGLKNERWDNHRQPLPARKKRLVSLRQLGRLSPSFQLDDAEMILLEAFFNLDGETFGARVNGFPEHDVKYWQDVALRGDSTAELLLGLVAVAQYDSDLALKHFSRGAEQGNSRCLVMLGVAHLDAWGTERDEVKAAGVFRRAHEAGEPYGTMMLANAFRYGLTGLEKDPERAFKLSLQAAKKGQRAGRKGILCEAFYQIGIDHFKGSGTLRDYDAAASNLANAASWGHATASFNLAVIEEQGLKKGDERDTYFRRCFSSYQRAASLGHVKGMHATAFAVQRRARGGDEWSRDHDIAHDLLVDAACHGYERAKQELGLLPNHAAKNDELIDHAQGEDRRYRRRYNREMFGLDHAK